jgi:Protein of unknown function (DUF3800)
MPTCAQFQAFLEGQQLLARLFVPGIGDRMATLAAFFDESGKLADTKVVAFAGCIAGYPEWEVMGNKWMALIRGKVAYVSMKDAIHFTGPFEGWRNRVDERDALLEQLAELAIDHISYWIPFVMTEDDFNRLPQSQRKQFKSPSYMGFEACVRAIADHNKNQQFVVIYDSSEEYSALCLKMYHRMRRQNPNVKEHCASITFAEDQRLPPLQLADMMAYCSRANTLKDRQPIPPIVERLYSILNKYECVGRYDLVYRHEDDLGEGSIERTWTPPTKD